MTSHATNRQRAALDMARHLWDHQMDEADRVNPKLPDAVRSWDETLRRATAHNTGREDYTPSDETWDVVVWHLGLWVEANTTDPNELYRFEDLTDTVACPFCEEQRLAEKGGSAYCPVPECYKGRIGGYHGHPSEPRAGRILPLNAGQKYSVDVHLGDRETRAGKATTTGVA